MKESTWKCASSCKELTLKCKIVTAAPGMCRVHLLAANTFYHLQMKCVPSGLIAYSLGILIVVTFF